MYKQIITATVALLLLAGPLYADLVLEMRTVTSPATTQPIISDSSISVLAVPGHDFLAKFAADGRTVELSGSIELMTGGDYRVKIKFAREGDGGQLMSTTLNLKPGVEYNLAGFQMGTFTSKTTLTIKPTKE